MIVGTVFKLAEINQDLSSVIFGLIFIVFMTASLVLFVRHLVSFLRAKISKYELRLIREWSENGRAMANWMRAHLNELALNMEGTISYPEFQELLRKDFEIYEKLIILDPKLKEDPIANKGRDFYRSLVRIENQKSS